MFNRFVVSFDLNCVTDHGFDDAVLLFDGIGYKEGRVFSRDYYPKDLAGLLAGEIDGEWVGVCQSLGKKIICTDFFGFYPIFYCSFGKLFFFSNSYDSLLTHIKKINFYPKLDFLSIFPMLASSYSFFDQAFSSHTGCEQVKRLLPDEIIEISGGSWEVKKKSNSSSLSYQDLIEQGSSVVRSDLRQLQEIGFQNTELSLSGGKDSRAILALGIDSISDLSIRTNPKFEDGGSLKSDVIDRDFDIALDMVSHYNLQWSRSRPVFADPVGFDQALSHYRFFRSSNYFRTNLSRFYTSLYPNGSYVELVGGCGEVLRGFWSDYFKKISYSSRIESDRLNKRKCGYYVFSALVGRNSKLKSYYDDSMSWFMDNISKIDGEDFYEAIDNHYFLHRNRYHFGNYRDAWRSGKLLYYPLGKKEFFQASKMIDSKLKSKGQVVFDIIKSNKAELHRFPYESPFGFSYDIPGGGFIRVPHDVSKKKKKDFLDDFQLKKSINKDIYRISSFDLKKNLSKKFSNNIDVCRSNDVLNSFFENNIFNFQPDSWSAKDIKLFTKIDSLALLVGGCSVNYSLISF
ncbi:hypothetical protein NBV64_17355 [Alcaligenes sp. DN25]|uniref:hypothetical protein n=1 Tax=Alcaligenes TaxID=507 RepID=UPI002030DE9C|nr:MULTISPECIES: hypothetical protein [Alcaligenes]URW82468.1 hypothetical protein NBV64_17355 [Alcaligenes sp. DN25]WEA67292.1 hypothetical protein PWH35_17390 [Alcaligenes faecalis]